MKRVMMLIIAVSAITSLAGCMSMRTDLVNVDGKRDFCEATGGGIGLGAVVGVAVAAASRSSCVSDKQKLGYLALDEAGFVGVVLPEDPKAAPLVVRVRDGSEAQKAGIQAGDEIVSINDRAPADTQETKAWLFGKIADPVKVALKRLEQHLEFLIKRESLAKATGQS